MSRITRKTSQQNARPARYVDVYSYDVPADDVEFLRPYAARDGHSAKSTGGLGRWAIINLARLLRDGERGKAKTK